MGSIPGRGTKIPHAMPCSQKEKQELKAGSCTPMFIAALFTIVSRWKQPKCPLTDVAYQYNGIVFSLKKEGNSGTCCSMDELWGHYAEWNKPVIKGKILYDSTWMRSLQYHIHRDRQYKGGCQGLGKGTEYQFYRMTSSGDDGGDLMMAKQCGYS